MKCKQKIETDMAVCKKLHSFRLTLNTAETCRTVSIGETTVDVSCCEAFVYVSLFPVIHPDPKPTLTGQLPFEMDGAISCFDLFSPNY